MDQKELCDSIAKQLDAASETVYWTLFLALIFLCAGLTGQNPITFLGMSVSRPYAFFMASTLFIVANFFVAIQFLRIRDILRRVSDETLSIALTKLWTHKWPANPFAFFGKAKLTQFHQALGLGLHVVILFIGWAAVMSLLKGTITPQEILSLAGDAAILGPFLLVLLSMTAVTNAAAKVFHLAYERIAKCDASLAAEFGATLFARRISFYAGTAVGGLCWWLLLTLAQRT
jgi:hypothetical protein